jgi:hypothetical protein
MQTPKFPYDLSRMAITARFHTISPLTGRPHRAWDIVPLYKRADGKPADIYPVFAGKAIRIDDIDPVYGKGIKVRTAIWKDLNDYLRSFGITGTNLDIWYWHMLDVEDVDGWVDQNIPLGPTGNTGWVYSNGTEVPDHMKGVSPYPGLHVHLEVKVDDTYIDPDIIFNYKPMNHIEFVRIKDTAEYGFLETTEFTKVLHRGINEADIGFMSAKFKVPADYQNAREISF